jgi:hypothetical protein
MKKLYISPALVSNITNLILLVNTKEKEISDIKKVIAENKIETYKYIEPFDNQYIPFYLNVPRKKR